MRVHLFDNNSSSDLIHSYNFVLFNGWIKIRESLNCHAVFFKLVLPFDQVFSSTRITAFMVDYCLI